MGQLLLAPKQEQQSLADSGRRMTDQRKEQEDMEAANAEYALQMASFAQQIAALDKYGKDYENKLRELQDKQRQLTQQHENEITQIRDAAEKARNARIMAGEQQLEDSIASGLARTILGHQSFAAMMNSLGNQVAEGLIQNALKSILADDMTKEKDAAAAARAAFRTSMQGLPFPANIVAAPVMGAAAFAAAMAFEGGGIVPGVGRGDVVPAMLTPGEGIIPGSMMDNLNQMARSGRMGGDSPTVHMHYRPTFHVNTIDRSGVQDMLKKHTKEFTQHFHKEVRRMGR